MNAQTAIDLIAHTCKNIDVDYAMHYGERGYDDPQNGILFANWNNVPRYLQNGLERRGFALEWSDEWVIEYNDSKAFRQSPDSYGWRPSYIMMEDCEIYDRRTMPIEDYAEALLNSDRHCDTVDRDFGELGFERIDSQTYETGFHPGQNDSPAKILKALNNLGFDVIFTIDSQGQFDVHWKAWTRKQVA